VEADSSHPAWDGINHSSALMTEVV